MYFSPNINYSSFHGEVLRYDTTSNFESPNSWSTFDASVNGVGNNPVGFVMGVFDGRYVYFVPYYNGSLFHGEVLRYDTTSNFESPESWSAFDAGENGVGNDPVGYRGATFDGRYVYFVPWKDSTGSYHGEVLRYDTKFLPVM